MKVVLALAALAIGVKAQCPADSGFSSAIMLDSRSDFTLQYKTNATHVFLRTRAQTTGFIGIGLSESGHMMGSDIVTMAVVNGAPRVEDRFAEWAPFDPAANSVTPTLPNMDTCQDWSALCGAESNGYSEFIITRTLVTNDKQDRKFDLVNDMYVIHAWGSSDTVSYHGANRGSTSINLSSASAVSSFQPPADATNSSVLAMSNYTVESARTRYVLKLFDVGALQQHIVAFEPIIPEGDKQYSHHMLLHDCGSDFSVILNILTLASAFGGATCDFESFVCSTGGLSPLGLGPCTNMMYGWAKGGAPVLMPDLAGVKIGDGAARYLVLELHIDNPTGQSGHPITTGVNLHLATALRQHDVGTIVLGNPGANMVALPGALARVHREATCPSSCTNTFAGPINMFLSFPHMHSFGREIWTTKFDSSGKSTLVSHKQFWNFNFQNQLAINITVNKGDKLNTHCVYDTSLKSSAVSFGTQSSEEMCMDFIAYYPKSNFDGLRCGWDATDKTACGRGSSSATPVNPQPDGLTAIPDEVSLGVGCSAIRTTTLSYLVGATTVGLSMIALASM